MKISVRDQIPDSSVLLRRARIPDLRASSTEELREIRTELGAVCEIARRAAIGKLVRDKRNAKGESPAEANCGFAGLFAALRRVRAELSRREARA